VTFVPPAGARRGEGSRDTKQGAAKAAAQKSEVENRALGGLNWNYCLANWGNASGGAGTATAVQAPRRVSSIGFRAEIRVSPQPSLDAKTICAGRGREVSASGEVGDTGFVPPGMNDRSRGEELASRRDECASFHDHRFRAPKAGRRTWVATARSGGAKSKELMMSPPTLGSGAPVHKAPAGVARVGPLGYPTLARCAMRKR